jgi:ubiquinone/menaquinone biosynthesis C-methylase UbiE
MSGSETLLTPAAVKAFYDRFGAKQDSQGFYEQPALDAMTAHLALGEARTVFEMGCGTGRFAAEMLAGHLPQDAHYTGLDISSTMTALAEARVRPHDPRASIGLGDGSLVLKAADGTFDRVIATYVLDLLSLGDIDLLVGEMARVLKPGGLMGLAGLAPGKRGLSRLVSGGWRMLHRLSPALVGGCRPVEIAPRLSPTTWTIRFHTLVAPYGIASEVIVAERRAE